MNDEYAIRLMNIAERACKSCEDVLGKPIKIETIIEDDAVTVYCKGSYLKITEQFAIRPTLQIGNLKTWNGRPLPQRCFAIGADCEICIGSLKGSNCIVGNPERIAAEAESLNIDWKSIPKMEDLMVNGVFDAAVFEFGQEAQGIDYGVDKLKKLLGRTVRLSFAKRKKR